VVGNPVAEHIQVQNWSKAHQQSVQRFLDKTKSMMTECAELSHSQRAILPLYTAPVVGLVDSEGGTIGTSNDSTIRPKAQEFSHWCCAASTKKTFAHFIQSFVLVETRSRALADIWVREPGQGSF
jgi:hypothetical protein